MNWESASSRFYQAIFCILSIVLCVSVHQQDAQADESPQTAVLVIDYGDGVQKHFLDVACKGGMTVLDVLEAAKRHPRGIQFVYRGKGATAFLTQIDDLKNEGRGKNWIFHVNGQLADRGFAVFPIKPADKVLWKFGKYE
jgi:hypothetical protein